MNIQEINELDDEKLVKMVQDGNDMLAFEILVRRYQNMLYNICFRFMTDRQDAFDCAQDSFIRAYENIRTFRHLSSFKTWLYRIAVNVCKNRLRSCQYRTRKKTVYIEDKTIDIEDCSNCPAQQYERERRQKIVQSAIDRLPFDQKQMIVLRDIEQLSYEEIEKITGFPSGTVKSKLSRAREKLKELLKDTKNEL